MNIPMPDSIGLHDPRYGEFVLVVEPQALDGTPAAALPLAAWPDRITRMLALPVSCPASSPTTCTSRLTPRRRAQVGIWLNAPSAMTALLDHGVFTALPGSRPNSRFTGLPLRLRRRPSRQR
jgi:hypothetical protein